MYKEAGSVKARHFVETGHMRVVFQGNETSLCIPSCKVSERFTGQFKLWRGGLMIDTWLWDQDVRGLSTGCARLVLSPWERHFPHRSYV